MVKHTEQMYNLIHNLFQEYENDYKTYQDKCMEYYNSSSEQESDDYAINYFPGMFEDYIMDNFNIKELKNVLKLLNKFDSEINEITDSIKQKNVTFYINIIRKLIEEHTPTKYSEQYYTNQSPYNNGEFIYNGYESY